MRTQHTPIGCFVRSGIIAPLILSHMLASCLQGDTTTPATRQDIVVTPEAMKLHRSSLVIDGHNDLPWAVREQGGQSFDHLDISQPQPKLHTDIARLRAGGIGAQFWSVFVPARTRHDGLALQQTLEQIQIVHDMVQRYPETFELALTADDIERIWRAGKIASLIGVEGGHSIENSLSVLRQLYDRGARYMTLTHSDTLDWADSATDEAKHGGLTAFGEEVVREMNGLGMLVDLSHVSVETMQDAIRVATAPVIFSHSSARAVCDHPRNVPDDILRELPRNGGLVMINFFSGYVVPEAAEQGHEADRLRQELMQQFPDDPDHVRVQLRQFDAQHPLPRGTVHDILDHIDHIVRIAGVDHVGLGSDYDGVGILPHQLEDVSKYPNITQGLLDRGYAPDDIRKILGQNVLRVMRAAEAAASSGPPVP